MRQRFDAGRVKRHGDGAVLGVELNAGNKQRQNLGLLSWAERVPDVVEVGEGRGDIVFAQSLAFQPFNLPGQLGKPRFGSCDPLVQVGNPGGRGPAGWPLDG